MVLLLALETQKPRDGRPPSPDLFSYFSESLDSERDRLTSSRSPSSSFSSEEDEKVCEPPGATECGFFSAVMRCPKTSNLRRCVKIRRNGNWWFGTRVEMKILEGNPVIMAPLPKICTFWRGINRMENWEFCQIWEGLNGLFRESTLKDYGSSQWSRLISSSEHWKVISVHYQSVMS